MSDESYLKVAGWGFIPLPGEKKHRRKALEEAREMLRIAEDCGQRDREDKTGEDLNSPGPVASSGSTSWSHLRQRPRRVG
ncbi:hypothetical protein [Actinoplanes sp. URMC 104]|uniref:hypothetical protein n=1 Tax=Actinoplanes sp. URMC 104 TaxID=3423409 RepID=UPI003F1C7482